MTASQTFSETLPALSCSIADLLTQRDSVITLLSRTRDSFNAQEEKCQKTGLGSFLVACNDSRLGLSLSPLLSGDIDSVVKEIDKNAWTHLMSQSGLRTFMNADMREKWDGTIRRGEAPPFTKENIDATFRGIHQRRQDIFEEGIVGVFHRLSPKAGKRYKTNDGMKFPMRFIIRSLVAFNGLAPGSGTNDLDDLSRCFFMLEGKPEPDARDGFFHQVRSRLNGGGLDAFVIENSYMKLRVFPKSETGHVALKRTELADELNRILAKRLAMGLGRIHKKTPTP